MEPLKGTPVCRPQTKVKDTTGGQDAPEQISAADLFQCILFFVGGHSLMSEVYVQAAPTTNIVTGFVPVCLIRGHHSLHHGSTQPTDASLQEGTPLQGTILTDITTGRSSWFWPLCTTTTAAVFSLVLFWPYTSIGSHSGGSSFDDVRVNAALRVHT